jgi:catechol 2,3-dioxygenase-like lactoylglutathione lyase family enzyme
MITPGIDHIALTVPDLDAQVDRLARNFGMVVEHRFDGFALVTDPGTGLKLELGQSEDSQVHFPALRLSNRQRRPHPLVEAGVETSEAPTAGTSPPCTRHSSHSPVGRGPTRQVRRVT